MSIAQEARVKFNLAPAFHFTLIENLGLILAEGCLLSKSALGARAVGDLSDAEIQKVRSSKVIPCTGRTIHSYVPLYFGFKTPMLSLCRDRNEDILYLRFPLDILGLGDAVFTDGNARDHETQFYSFGGVEDLKVLDHRTINAVSWGADEEKKRRKQAEILIPDRLPLTYLIDIWCYSENSRQRVQSVLKQAGATIPVLIKPGFYFR